MIDLEFRSQATPPEEFRPCRSGMLAIASFIIHYLSWQAAISLGPDVRVWKRRPVDGLAVNIAEPLDQCPSRQPDTTGKNGHVCGRRQFLYGGLRPSAAPGAIGIHWRYNRFDLQEHRGTASGMQRKRLVHVLLTAALTLSANLACADDRNLLPKYGPLPRTEWQKAADAKFISAIDEQYHGDRNKASTELAARGWQYLAERNFADAMRRFNQAWLLNNSNGTALWGMATIQASSGKFDDSLKLFAEAEKFVGSDINFLVDYTKALGMAGVKLNDDALPNDAFGRFERIYQKAPQNTKNLQNWAITLFSIGRYSEAWAKVKLAEATPNKNDLDPRFLAALQSRMPRPQN